MAEEDVDRTKIKKCAHQNCTCTVSGEHRYCSHYCEDAADTDPTGACTCEHPGCRGT